MPQAKLSGPQSHPLAKADRVARIDSDPATWIHDESDSCPCSNCEEHIRLARGEYLPVTLRLGHYLEYRTEIERFCSETCYREWATEALEEGW